MLSETKSSMNVVTFGEEKIHINKCVCIRQYIQLKLTIQLKGSVAPETSHSFDIVVECEEAALILVSNIPFLVYLYRPQPRNSTVESGYHYQAPQSYFLFI